MELIQNVDGNKNAYGDGGLPSVSVAFLSMEERMEKEYLLFDLDGTLTDPKEGITKSVQYALKHYGIWVDDLDSLCPFIGPPLKDSFQKYYGFPEEQAREAIQVYREYFSV